MLDKVSEHAIECKVIRLASSQVRFEVNHLSLFRSGHPNFYHQNATNYLNPMFNPNMPAQYPPNPHLPNMNYNPNLQRRRRRQRPSNQEPMGASNAVNALVGLSTDCTSSRMSPASFLRSASSDQQRLHPSIASNESWHHQCRGQHSLATGKTQSSPTQKRLRYS